MSRLRRSRTSAASASLLLLLLALLTACGSSGAGDVKPGGDAAGGGSSAASPTPTDPTASATTSRTSTSGLEAKAPVKAARAWAAAVAEEVNSKSTSHAQTQPLTTRRGARTLPAQYREYYGLTFPGPLPFTPLSVRMTGSAARIPVCIQTRGWAVDAQNTLQNTQLTASTFVLKRVGGSWRLDTITGRQESCADVIVKGSTQ